MAFYSYLSTKIIIAFITKSYQDLFGVRSYINAIKLPNKGKNNGLQNIAFLASFRPRIYPYITKFIASQRPIYVPPILTTGSIVKNKDNGII